MRATISNNRTTTTLHAAKQHRRGGGEGGGNGATTTTTTKSSASSIRCLSWRRDNRKIAAGSSDGHVLIWDVLTGELETRFTNVGTLSHVEFTKDFKALLLSPSGFKAPMFRAISKRSGFMWPDTIVPLPYGSTDEADVHGCPAILTKSGNYCIYATTRGGLCVARLKEEGEGTQMRRGWTLVQTIDLVANDAKMVKRLELSRDGRTLLVVSFSKGIVAYDVTETWRIKIARRMNLFKKKILRMTEIRPC